LFCYPIVLLLCCGDIRWGKRSSLIVQNVGIELIGEEYFIHIPRWCYCGTREWGRTVEGLVIPIIIGEVSKQPKHICIKPETEGCLRSLRGNGCYYGCLLSKDSGISKQTESVSCGVILEGREVS
jgi:hypothetical protein